MRALLILIPCPHGRQVLGPEARLRPVLPDILDAKGDAQERGQAQGGANDLPAPFTEAAVDLHHSFAQRHPGEVVPYCLAPDISQLLYSRTAGGVVHFSLDLILFYRYNYIDNLI